ncbi:MAG TPA: MerR family transcriptional regulator [Candidatus Limnocylindria bacterium]|nr:MerR family transcriptional regulator [Candidatus Limnocylindria bacterium]
MRVGELARRSGISATTLRYYERMGLLRPAARSVSGYRDYPKESVQQLALIGRAKELGFSLKEIKALLARPRGTSREALLTAVSAKLTQLERERRSLGSKERSLRDVRTRVLRDADRKGDDITRWLLSTAEADGAAVRGPSLGHFDEQAFRVINTAAVEAKRYTHNWLGTEHLLLGLMRLRHDGIRRLLSSERLDLRKIRKSFEAFDFGPTSGETGVFITHRVQRVFGLAEGLALRDGRPATAEDLFFAVLEDGGGVAVHLMRDCGGDPARIAAALREKLVYLPGRPPLAVRGRTRRVTGIGGTA